MMRSQRLTQKVWLIWQAQADACGSSSVPGQHVNVTFTSDRRLGSSACFEVQVRDRDAVGELALSLRTNEALGVGACIVDKRPASDCTEHEKR